RQRTARQRHEQQAYQRPASQFRFGFQLAGFESLPCAQNQQQRNRPKHQRQNPHRAAERINVQRQPGAPDARQTKQVQPTTGDQKRRQRQPHDSTANPPPPPTPLQSRHKQRHEQSGRHRQQRGQCADEQTVYEQRPVHDQRENLILGSSQENLSQ